MRRHDVSGRLRVVVLGYVVRGPLAGFAWHHLQYVSCAAALGHDVLFLEDSGPYPSCYDPRTGKTGVDPRYGLRFTHAALTRLGVGDRWAYFDAHGSGWHGPRAATAVADCGAADVLIDLCDAEPLPPWVAEIPVRALIDTDPVFSQVRHIEDPVAREAALEHTAFFSFGEGISAGTSSVPDDGLPWQSTRQPIDLDSWTVDPPSRARPWTTVMQWDSYPAVEYDGVSYGTKRHSFEPYIDLPSGVHEHLEIALGSPSAPRERLRRAGWILRNPLQISASLDTYQDYLRRSRGEFSVAKQAYTMTRSEWFSERSACYLASGRPVVVEDTGFSRLLPTGAGLLAFSTPVEAAECLRLVERDYARHCRAARQVAEEHFDGRLILSSLIERAIRAQAPAVAS